MPKENLKRYRVWFLVNSRWEEIDESPVPGENRKAVLRRYEPRAVGTVKVRLS